MTHEPNGDVQAYAVLSREMYLLVESIEARLAIGVAVPLCEFEAALYAIYSGAYADFHTARVLA